MRKKRLCVPINSHVIHLGIYNERRAHAITIHAVAHFSPHCGLPC